jgi:hypothetical protein
MGTSNTRAGSKINRVHYFGPSGDGNHSATPNPAPHTVIDMMNLGAQAANSQTPSTPNAHQARDSQDGDGQEGDEQEVAGQQVARQDDPNRPPPVSENTPWFPLLLCVAILFTALPLMFHHENLWLKLKAEWTREGSVKKLTPGQAIFVSVSKSFIWGRFLAFLCFQVLILAAVRWAPWAVPSASTKAKLMRTLLQELLFTVTVALVGLVMWGWLLWLV